MGREKEIRGIRLGLESDFSEIQGDQQLCLGLVGTGRGKRRTGLEEIDSRIGLSSTFHVEGNRLQGTLVLI